MAKSIKKTTGSIDDITPQEWDEMNRRHLEELKRKQTQESEKLSGETLFYSDVVTDNDYQITLDPEYEVNVPSFTIGNDMSSRSIEGENPLYLPQAKVYNKSFSIGPCIISSEGIDSVMRIPAKAPAAIAVNSTTPI